MRRERLSSFFAVLDSAWRASTVSLTKVSAVAPVRPGGNAVTKMPCYAWIRGDCKLGDKCRFEHDPKSAPKSCGADEKGKNSKGK